MINYVNSQLQSVDQATPYTEEAFAKITQGAQGELNAHTQQSRYHDAVPADPAFTDNACIVHVKPDLAICMDTALRLHERHSGRRAF
jgi:hypothetical protein